MNHTKEIYNLFIKHKKISIDSRKIEKDSIFFALKGDNFNGNKFAAQAIEKGAALAIIDEEEYKKGDKFILVENVLDSLQELSKFYRQQFDIPFIAITGSNGKTTTKELINVVLSKKYKTHSTLGNLNNHIGVPLTILSIPIDSEMVVVEMGANHIGEISKLCEIAQPNFGIITNIAKAHLEGFGGFDGVVIAKNELYESINKDGVIFVNNDDELLLKLSDKLKKIKYGLTHSADCYAELNELNPFVKLKWNGFEIQSQLIGKYNFDNILAAICIGNYFGVDDEMIKSAIENFKPKNNRSQIVETINNKVILDAYNANPTSMKAAIESFRIIKAKKKIAILGDMLELGEASEIEHQQIKEFACSQNFDKIIFVGEIFCSICEKQNELCFEDNQEVLNYLKNNKISGTSVLIKGSRKIKLEVLLEEL